MSNAHAAPASAPVAHAAAPSTNAWKEFGAEVTGETIEGWSEDLTKKVLPGVPFALALVKKFPFAKSRFFGAVMGNSLAAAVRLIPWLPEESKNAVTLLVRHVTLGLAEGVAETIRTQADWDRFVDLAGQKIDPKDRVPDANESEAIVSERLDYFHKPECAILLRDMTNFAADNPAKYDKQKVGTKKVGNREIDDEKVVEIRKPYPAKSKNLGKLLAHPSGPCPVCYKGEFPLHKEEKHVAKGLKDKLGQKAIDLFLAANATIAEMGTGKLFAVDEIQEWKDVDPDLIKAMAERLHPKIVDGKLPKAELEELLTLIPASGVEKLSAINAVGKAWKSAKEFLGESPKKEMKELLDAYSVELVDFLRAGENRYDGLGGGEKRGFHHLKAVLQLPDLSQLDELAREIWTAELRNGAFKDEAQFLAWNSAVALLVKAHEYDKERRNPTLRALAKTAVGWMKATRFAAILLSVAMVIGWILLGFKDVKGDVVENGAVSSVGMILIIAASVGLVILALLLLLPEWALKAGDIFFPKWNKTDDTVASVRWKVSAAVGILFVNGCLAYGDLVQPMGCLMIFGASIVLPIVTSALLRLGGAYLDLLRSQRIAGLIYSAVVGAIPATLLVGILLHENPGLHDEVLRGVAMAVIAGAFVLGAWKAFKMILEKGNESTHGGVGTTLLACLAGLAVLAVGTKSVLMVKKVDFAQVTSQVSARMPTPGISGIAMGNSGDALEAAKQKAMALKAGTAANATPPATTQVDIAPTPEPTPTPAPAHGNAKHLTKAQAKAEIAKLEKALKKEYGDSVPPLADLQQQYAEFGRKLTAINARFGSDEAGLKVDAEYQDTVAEMERLAGQIDLRKQIVEATAALDQASEKATEKKAAPKAVAQATGSEDEADASEEDGVKAYCLTIPPLVRAKVPSCKGV